MISEFLREQEKYSKEQLRQILHCTEEEIESLIRKLEECNVLRTVKETNRQGGLRYVLQFVGVAVFENCVLKCYPKYLRRNKKPKEELRQVLKVLEKHKKKEQNIPMLLDDSEGDSSDFLSILLFLLEDYAENGVYQKVEKGSERDGSGEILWEKTMREMSVFVLENKPYYIEYQTKRWAQDSFDYWKRLHECILTRASIELEEADLLNLFGITALDLTEEELEEFGEREEILFRIEQELQVQFDTRKRLVLKAMYAYLMQGGCSLGTEAVCLFGTNQFYHVWEQVCAEILDNQLNHSLGSLSLPVSLRPQYDPRQRLLDLIEKPFWTAAGARARDTLIPDLITIWENQFFIFDAKYYDATLEMGEKLQGQPGIEDVTKQYLYQLAYQPFLRDHKFTVVKNCFLMPTEDKQIEDRGEVRLEMLCALGLENIKVRFLPAHMAYDLYLSGRKLNIIMLKL